MFPMIVNWLILKGKTIPVELLNKSEPFNKFSFNEIPLYFYTSSKQFVQFVSMKYNMMGNIVDYLISRLHFLTFCSVIYLYNH